MVRVARRVALAPNGTSTAANPIDITACGDQVIARCDQPQSAI
jgi:hypothetical protein